jgi:hypothetical protein
MDLFNIICSDVEVRVENSTNNDDMGRRDG